MRRMIARSIALPVLLAILSTTASAAKDSPALLLPLRAIGVSDTTVFVVGDLLQGELESAGIDVMSTNGLGAELPFGENACDDAECAAALAADHGAAQVVYGSLSRLGEKIILRIRALRTGETDPYYADQITAIAEEDLDAVVRRAADGIATGATSSDRATVDTVTLEETIEPRRRASRSGLGIRAGGLFPASDSYGGVDRLTSLRLVIKHEAGNLMIESTPLLGFSWRDETVEWTIFDLFAARIFGTGDFSPYLGGGLGIHSLSIEKQVPVTYDGFTYVNTETSSETTLTADVGVGLLALRTYDFSIAVDLRYHYVFADFDAIGDDGAHGLSVTFGIGR